MSETPHSAEQPRFEVSSIEELRSGEYKLNLWRHTDDEIQRMKKSGELQQMSDTAFQEAERRIRENGGLTIDDLFDLHFWKDNDPRFRNDI